MKLIIFGDSEIAELAHYYFTNDTAYDVACFTLDDEYVTSDTFCGCPVVPMSELKEKYSSDDYEAFVAVSYKKMNSFRESKVDELVGMNYRLASYVSPHAYVAKNVSIGYNCFILEDNTVQPFVKIGNNVTLWSGNHIGHHSVIGDNTFISSHVVISGGVNVGKNVFAGVNATIYDHLKIADFTFIGGGCTIQKNTKEAQAYINDRSKPHTLTANDLLN